MLRDETSLYLLLVEELSSEDSFKQTCKNQHPLLEVRSSHVPLTLYPLLPKKI